MNLADAQEASETRGLLDGERRYVNRVSRAYSHGAATLAAPVRHLLGCAIDWLAAELSLRVEAHDAMKPMAYMPWVKQLGSEIVAYLTLKAALDCVGSTGGYRLNRIAGHLCEMLVDEQRAQRFQDTDPSAFAHAMNSSRYATRRGARADAILTKMRYHNIPLPERVPRSKQVLIGTQLLAVMIETTALFTLEQAHKDSKHHNRVSYLLVPTEETREWIRKRDDHLRLLMPMHPPTLIEPKDWAPGIKGGYHYGLSNSLSLVRHASKAQEYKLATDPMPLVYSALNTLQRTSWRINTRVLSVVEAALDGKIPALLPDAAFTIIPPRPRNDPEALIRWRRLASEAHETNNRRHFKRADAERAFATARRLKDEDRFYFPYTLDFRGRAYPCVEFLHPHGPDVTRGLLAFADGILLTQSGAGWLAVHGANTLGQWWGHKLTRLNFQERVNVIRDITPAICATAADPIGNRSLWTQADDPWQFLAFCFEWAEWQETGKCESHIPVGLDGTCNGLQHFSAMLRDSQGASVVNLMNSDRPTDIYYSVAESLTARLQERFATDKVATLWLSSGLVTRDLVKRPVMTLAYGATAYGFVDQLLEKLRSKEEMWQQAIATFRPAGVRIRPAVQYLAKILWEVLQQTVGGALAAMQWLQNSASVVAAVTGGPVPWSVPMTNFPAHMEYWVQKRARIQTHMAGTIVSPSTWHQTSKPLMRKITNAIAPNVVHSLDAAAMMATTVACHARGVLAFSMIHDSFAVHAENIPILADAIRTSFIDLYRDRNILEELATQWRKTGAEIADLPQLGEFNVEDVRSAQFFFS